MDPQENLKDSRAQEIQAHAVYATPSAPDSNEAMLAMVAQMKNEAAADRQAAAADRQKAAEERRLHEQNQQQQNQQRNMQHAPVQQQQPMPYGQPQYQQQMGHGPGATTVIQVPNNDVDHCQHFLCFIFLGG